MNKLSILHHQLAALRRTRRVVRLATAHSALLATVLWVLAAVFVLDFLFEMSVLQRLIVLGLGAAAVGWAFCRFTLPLLGKQETELDVALMVEQQQQIDSDLVAALQFETPQASQWGSTQLEQAVIDYVGQLGWGLNVFEGFSRRQMVRRGLTLAATLAVLGGLVVLFPAHSRVFLNRVLLGSLHYPTDTIIEQIVINEQPVLLRQKQGTAPGDARAAQSRPLTFAVLCSGELPGEGQAQLASVASRQRRPLTLEKLTLQDRRQRLTEARARIDQAAADPDLDLAGPWRRELTSLVRFDAPEVAELLDGADQDRSRLQQAGEQLQQQLEAWPGNARQQAVYEARLARLVEPLRYQLYLGDAWTDPADIAMIPLPVVEPRLTAIPPSYARRAAPESSDPSARHLAVLEGSRVQVSLECTNKKRLTEAWLVTRTQDGSQRFPLTRQDKQGFHWTLDADNTPFSQVQQEIRYEMQVTDEDHLHLEPPIRGYIRLRPDRPPSGSADLVHRVVLPTARPRIEYRVNDDYGVARVELHLEVERRRLGYDATGDGSDDMQDMQQTENLLPTEQPVTADRLPYHDHYDLDLAPLNLRKGDRLKLALEVVDYRGESPGRSYRSDPLVLEISDESGVLAAISEADERSEQRLSDIIRQQLGIGESP